MRLALLTLVVLAAARGAEAQRTPRGATDAGASQRLPENTHYVPPPDRRPAHFPEAWRFPAGRAPVVAKHAMAVSDAPIASAVGADIMRRGGNAVDAAVATAFALAVVYPEAGNIGGGGFMVIHLADGRDAAIDFREKAPLAATRDMYVGPDGKVTEQSTVGPLASGVPGSVAGLTAALARYGTMSLARVMQPAIRLAEQGFVLDGAFSQRTSAYRALLSKFAGGAVFAPNGQPLAVGTVVKQPALARTLRAIVRTGGKAF